MEKKRKMVRSRSAEQTARLLLSNAVRHDTWECKASMEGAEGPSLTLSLEWGALPADFPLRDVVALQITFYDEASCVFIGATYTAWRDAMTEPLIFRSRAERVLMVVELVVRDERDAAAAGGQRVAMWGHLPVAELCGAATIALRPGGAQLLQLSEKSWPVAGGDSCGLKFTCVAIEDVVLVQLMARLVPPNIIVPRSFTENMPQASVSSFRCAVTNIQLCPTMENLEWWDRTAEWRIATVAHNGYQQLGHGAEVALVLDDDTAFSLSEPTVDVSLEGTPRRTTPSLLRSVAPLEIDGLPVHSATSLVLAIRRRKAGEQRFEVLGFSVFPLCVMPMVDRDLRVENLPTLHGPFSCRDSRMVMLESASPYGKLPLTMRLTVEYYHTNAYGDMSSISCSDPQRTGRKTLEELSGVSGSKKEGFAQTGLPPFVETGKPMGIVSTEKDSDIPVLSAAAGGTMGSSKPSIELQYPTEDAIHADKRPLDEHSSVDIFRLLCNLMEEMRRLREMQEAALRHGRPKAVPLAPISETGKRLDDAVGIDVVDLSPSPVAITWETRCKMVEDLQPILHPVHGVPLEDCALGGRGDTMASLYGIRFEGLTADVSIDVPEVVCFMFSFGSLPLQTLGPIHTARIDRNLHLQTFKLFEKTQRGGVVWCEPLESATDPFLQKYRQRGETTLYIHVYNALTMFYIGSVNFKLDNFRRPYNAESARIPMDFSLYCDLTLTERSVPAKVFPIVRNAGQLHVTLFCVAVKGGSVAQQTAKVVEPPKGSRVIVAKKLSHADFIKQFPDAKNNTDATATHSFAVVDAVAVAAAAGAVPPDDFNRLNTSAEPSKVPLAPMDSNVRDATANMHWRRVQHVKQLYGNETTLPGVPHEHPTQEADLEFRLRYLEKQRDEVKSRKIGETLIERLTVHHYVHVASCCPERTRTKFQNPFTVAMQFSLEVDRAAVGALEVVSSPSFYLGPREQTEVVLVVRLHNVKRSRGGEPQLLRARLLTEGRGVVRIIDVHATVGPPLVDRRFEIFGPAETKVSRKIFSRTFSSSMFPITSDQVKLLARMRDMCACITITSETTTAEANAVLDPITQTHVTAWEEITVHTTIPPDDKRQRVEYLTLYKDAAMSEVIETWELCIFACQAITSRELFFGQTTTVSLPATGVEALYCSHAHVKVERRDNSYLLHVRSPEVGTQQMLLHALMNNHLAKTLLTLPTVYPTPTYTQTIEISLADTTAPVFRRLQFVHRGSVDEMFTVHHNYKQQLCVAPKQFALAPGEAQFITLQMDMLTLPEGHMEGRWPMWIFINNAKDKTVESYLLHVVLRAHRVVYDMA